MFTVKETATRLRVSPATVYALISTGKLRCHRVGVGRGVIRVSPDNIAHFLEESESSATEKTISRPARPRLKHIRL